MPGRRAVAPEDLAIEVERRARPVEGLVDRLVRDRPVVRPADEPAGKILQPSVLDVVHGAGAARRVREEAEGAHVDVELAQEAPDEPALRAVGGGRRECEQGGAALLGGAVLDQAGEQVGWGDVADHG